MNWKFQVPYIFFWSNFCQIYLFEMESNDSRQFLHGIVTQRISPLSSFYFDNVVFSIFVGSASGMSEVGIYMVSLGRLISLFWWSGLVRKIKLITFFFTWPFIPLIFSLSCLINMDVLSRGFSLSLQKWCCIAVIIGLQPFLLSPGVLLGWNVFKLHYEKLSC